MVAGQYFIDTRFEKTYLIKEVTEKRVIIFENGIDYSTTGRKQTTWWVGIKAFEAHVKKGNYQPITNKGIQAH